MSWIVLEADGSIAAILNDPPGAAETRRVVEMDVPQEYPEAADWQPAQGNFEPNLAKAKLPLVASVNARAEHIRGVYLTAGSGQAMTYLRKEDEARRFDPGGDPSDYPFLSAEAAATGATLADTAALVLAQADAWATLGAAIEGHRRGLIVAIEAAQNIETLDQLDVSAGWPGQAETQS